VSGVTNAALNHQVRGDNHVWTFGLDEDANFLYILNDGTERFVTGNIKSVFLKLQEL